MKFLLLSPSLATESMASSIGSQKQPWLQWMEFLAFYRLKIVRAHRCGLEMDQAMP